MTEQPRSSATDSSRGNPLVRATRALGRRFIALVRTLVASLGHVVNGRRRTHAPRARTGCAVPVPLDKPATRSAPLPEVLAARLTPPSSGRVCSEFECVVAESAFHEPRYHSAFAQLQCGPRSKLWDLRAVQTIQLDLFERLADAWKVGREAVPRLGILLGYEHWIVFHVVAARRLRPIVHRGIGVEIFYTQQLPDSVPAWFAGDRVDHPLPAILEWLRADWHPTPIWARVLDTTAMLVTAFGHREQVPDQLLQLAAIALSLRGIDAATEAAKHAQAALSWLGDTPSRMRCRALRMLASAMLVRGETDEALAQLDAAIGIAAVIRDPIRGALALLSADDLPYLRATLHHQLAIALHEQRKNADEAEHHAAAAAALRWDPDSRLARNDRALLARIRAGRASQPGKPSTTAP